MQRTYAEVKLRLGSYNQSFMLHCGDVSSVASVHMTANH
jgi:hypothetical protein